MEVACRGAAASYMRFGKWMSRRLSELEAGVLARDWLLFPCLPERMISCLYIHNNNRCEHRSGAEFYLI